MSRKFSWALGLPLAAAVIAVAAVSVLPEGSAKAKGDPPTQVIYRFDDHRHLELTGWGCEGAIVYVDQKRDIRTPYIEQFGRVFLPDIVHADSDGDFVFIPYSDVSAFAVSKDHGKTFQTARWVGSRTFGVEDVKRVTVVNQQAFVQLRDGRLFMTCSPFGEGWGMNVIDAKNYLPQTTLAEYPNFQNLPADVPEVMDYKGWTQMRCDPDLGAESRDALNGG